VTIRVGAVSYLNALPLVQGLDRAPGIVLSCATPAVLAEEMAAGRLDLALLPIAALAEIPDLEIVPGLAIGTRGPSRSVLLVSRCPAPSIESLALDPESRTSNLLAELLLAEVWGRRVRRVRGSTDLVASLALADAAVRIGDKALFEPVPEGLHVFDLGELWTRETSLPFVFAAWIARPGLVDRALYLVLHNARREGRRALSRIAADYTWRGVPHPEIAQAYLAESIRNRLGADEIRAMELFFATAARLGLVERAPALRLALARFTTCHAVATARELTRGSR